MYRRYFMVLIAALLFVMQGCSTKDDSPAGSGTGQISVSITDAPAYGYDHVWITVKDLWFHKSETAETDQTGWLKFPLSAPVTFDLLALGNGAISVPVWEDIELPRGDYTQMRVFLVRTDAPLTESAAGLTYNNQVDVTSDASYPLRVFAAERGIMLTGQFTVKQNEKLKLAVDFDAGSDVVKMEHDGRTDYILKPRLAYFDLDNAGAVVGSIDAAAAGNNPSAQFVIKAEQVVTGAPVRFVRRITALADATGKFVLFPLLPGDYDLVIRGINYQTAIIKGVPVTKGTTPDTNPTTVPVVAMTPAGSPDYEVNATIASPTGAWVDFVQTLATGEVPYAIRFRHFNPLTGKFDRFLMSSDQLQVGDYNATAVSLSPVTPVEGNGGYKAAAVAPLHKPSSFGLISASSYTLTFGNLAMTLPAVERTVSGSIIVPETFASGFLDRGVLFACHGGMIVNATKVDSQMASGGTYTISNLPGGTPEHPLTGAFYSIEALGWSSSNPANRALAAPQRANLSTGSATGIDVTMGLPTLP